MEEGWFDYFIWMLKIYENLSILSLCNVLPDGSVYVIW